MRRLALCVALLAVLSACGGSAGGDAPADSEAPANGGAAADPTDERSSPCTPASAALVSAIEAGLTVTGGGSLSNALIVQSDDFENVHFVAARIEGEGMGDSVGVWATNAPNGDGSIFSAEALAAEFSDWGDGPGFSPSDDGLSDARDCAGG